MANILVARRFLPPWCVVVHPRWFFISVRFLRATHQLRRRVIALRQSREFRGHVSWSFVLVLMPIIFDCDHPVFTFQPSYGFLLAQALYSINLFFSPFSFWIVCRRSRTLWSERLPPPPPLFHAHRRETLANLCCCIVVEVKSRFGPKAVVEQLRRRWNKSDDTFING
jgi:hypothetical protein